jgi:CubicO group peptidase (beta-lactamase class C family)
MGMNGGKLDKIDGVVAEMIAAKAAPGARVLVVKEGTVVFDRSYGHLDYEKSAPVTSETVYDLASVTKVAATTLAAMFLHSRG